jgi:hypothetical protein
MRTSRGHLSKAETGSALPSLGWVERFVELAGTNLHAFFEGIDVPHLELAADPFVSEITKLLPTLSGYNRRIIIEVLQDLDWKARSSKTRKRR